MPGLSGNQLAYRKARVKEYLEGCTAQQVIEILKYARIWDEIYQTVWNELDVRPADDRAEYGELEEEPIGDFAERKLRDLIARGDPLATKFALERLDRGGMGAEFSEVVINIVPYDTPDKIKVTEAAIASPRGRGRRRKAA